MDDNSGTTSEQMQSYIYNMNLSKTNNKTMDELDGFLESKYKEFQMDDNNMKNINIWDIIMYLNSSNNSSWFDLENDIKFFLLSKYRNVRKYKTSIGLFNKLLYDFQNSDFKPVIDDDSFSYYKEQISEKFILYFAIKYLNFNDSKISFYDILMSQLHVFEKQFSDYINKEIQKHENYAYDMNHLLNTLTDNFSNHSGKGIYYFNLLTFNYTIGGESSPIIDNVKGLQSIHGSTKYKSLNSSNIIMGIDSNLGRDYEELTYKERQEIYSFTKTSRLLNFKRKKLIFLIIILIQLYFLVILLVNQTIHIFNPYLIIIIFMDLMYH
ncbi:hypothetical protein [Apilactobacillus micheneri]|uniref:hypothetical protein n=1 Tax=Apilactobacillus micheneri TaxID=1899430 RepID=UPI000D03C0DB|nr:hypothetical protein [Apilactobacillus micheneri]